MKNIEFFLNNLQKAYRIRRDGKHHIIESTRFDVKIVARK